MVWTLNTGASHSGPFAAYTAYTAVVTLTAASGYSLVGGAFTHTGGMLNGAAEWSNTGSTITGMRIVFPEAGNVPPVPVTDLDLTSRVSAPVTGGTPITYFSTAQYTGNVAWATSLGAAHTGAFQAGGTYTATATVTLTPGSGYTLDGLGPTAFTCTGATSVTYIAGSSVVFIVFPAAGSGPGNGPRPDRQVHRASGGRDTGNESYRVPVCGERGMERNRLHGPPHRGFPGGDGVHGHGHTDRLFRLDL